MDDINNQGFVQAPAATASRSAASRSASAPAAPETPAALVYSKTSLGDSFYNLLPVIDTELIPINQRGQFTPAESLELFRGQDMIAKINGIKLDPFDDKQINDNIYIENYINNFCEQIFNNISKKQYPGETYDIPRRNHGGLNHLRSLKFGIWIITKIIEKSKKHTYESLFPSKQFLIMVILSTMFESIMRVNEDGSGSVLCGLSKNYLKKIYPDLDLKKLGGTNYKLSTHQLASSIFFMVLMRQCFNTDIISDKDIQLLGRGVAYHYIDDSLNIQELTIDDINGSNNLNFFIYYVITVSGHYLDHCRVWWVSEMINEPYIVKLFELFDIQDEEKKKLIKLIITTLRYTEFYKYNGEIENIDNTNMKTSCRNLDKRYYNPNFQRLSYNFKKCYDKLNLELAIKNLLKIIPTTTPTNSIVGGNIKHTKLTIKSKNSYKNKKSKKSKKNKKTNKSKNSYKNKKSKKSKIN
jgi:hypothetical protein